LHTQPAALMFDQLDAPLVVAFLDDLEKHRSLSARSRNLRLTAIHSFFRYAAFEAPSHAAQIQRVLAIPSKRFTRTLVRFLTPPEVEALLAAPDQRTWFGRRDHAFLLTAERVASVECGSEVDTRHRSSCSCDRRPQDEAPWPGHGGRAVARASANGRSSPTPVGRPEPRRRTVPSGYTVAAAKVCPSLKHKRVTAHMLRAAVDLLQVESLHRLGTNPLRQPRSTWRPHWR
jgi:hypothetical protein